MRLSEVCAALGLAQAGRNGGAKTHAQDARGVAAVTHIAAAPFARACRKCECEAAASVKVHFRFLVAQVSGLEWAAMAKLSSVAPPPIVFPVRQSLFPCASLNAPPPSVGEVVCGALAYAATADSPVQDDALAVPPCSRIGADLHRLAPALTAVRHLADDVVISRRVAPLPLSF